MKKFADEFKEFIAKGNVMDMAVGVIIGGAFGKDRFKPCRKHSNTAYWNLTWWR